MTGVSKLMFGTPAFYGFFGFLSAAPSTERAFVVEVEKPLRSVDPRFFLDVYVEPRGVVIVRVGEYFYLLRRHIALTEHDPQLPRLLVA